MKNKLYKVTRTVSRENANGDFIAVLHPSQLPLRLFSKSVVIYHTIGNDVFKIPVLLTTDNKIPADEIKLDMKIRIAIGSNVGDMVGVNFYNWFTILQKIRVWTRLFGKQVNLLRTKYASYTDMEINLCRISKHVMKTIGVQEGENVFVESANGKISIKAFDLPDSMVTSRIKKENNPDSIYSKLTEDKRRRDLILGKNDTDLPWILLDSDSRSKLGIKTNDPVRVYRDLRYSIKNKLHLVSIPLVLTIIGFILSLEFFKSNEPLKIILYSAGLLVVICLNLWTVRLKIK